MEIANGVYKAKLSQAQAKVLNNAKRTPCVECLFDVTIDEQTTVVKKYSAFVSEAALPYTIKMLLGAGVSEKEISRIEAGEEKVEIALPIEVKVKIENEPNAEGTKIYANIKSVFAGEGGAGLGQVADRNEFRAAMGGQSLLAAAKAEVAATPNAKPSASSVAAAAAALNGSATTPSLDTNEEVPF